MIPTMTARVNTSASRGSVFVIEDDEQLLEALSLCLEGRGYRVRSERNGRAALSGLEAGPVPDVIVLDLMMPEMSGWEFRVEQRKHPHVASVPVVAISGDSSAQAQAVDASAYLKKPFDVDELVDTIDRVVVDAERVRLRAQAAQAERLRSLGLLAAGIAHEINNPLAFAAGANELAISGQAELEALLGESGAEPLRRLRRYQELMTDGLERISEVVKSIATFATPNATSAAPTDVQQVVEASIRLTLGEIRHRAQLVRVANPMPFVLGNSSELGQVFVNLLLNAVHALPEGKFSDNRLVVTTEYENGRVVISIEDNGSGISLAAQPHVFDPFFTTKPVGQGMGLGLSLSRTIVEGMGGQLTFVSEVGVGTTFRVELPALVGPGSAAQPLHGEDAVFERPEPAAGTGKRRLLALDDEPMLCETLRIMLSDTFDVVTVTSPLEALARIRAGEMFDVILCDLMMPEMTGMDFHAELAANHAKLLERMVFMTGGTFSERSRGFITTMEDRVLYKPFRARELFELVDRCVLERPSASVH